jgi:hypothetical protein
MLGMRSGLAGCEGAGAAMTPVPPSPAGDVTRALRTARVSFPPRWECELYTNGGRATEPRTTPLLMAEVESR